ncbi:MAG: DUF411 domain-containing protein [Gemmatimonadetes bacterium]|nr:DUF411 domain-containing protein [Gemmatimonadota bacterium]
MSSHPSFDGAGAATPRSRRAVLAALAGAAGALVLGRPVAAFAASAPLPKMVVYKDPGCGCCKEWVAHVQKAGFTVESHDTADMDSVKKNFGIPAALASCHTARVGTLVVEGHVPADLIIKLLNEKGTTRGLAVPGMPIGSPGMEVGTRKDAYDVLAIEKDGRTRVYAKR